ncbi:serine hydrolase [Mycolicibacterium neoaurum]|uniref:serine hydrolase n=1 Tax=Mycolicibacterium neoaurum TaxID=1795 RepID=UPI00248CDD44|nr:serine hydrolase [Mycolicibacterium neoaurum]WBP95141.1 serine hydrolase [Mycolicibacterium neoaurum]WBS08561.1 serine hydrolase [Mycolicibacterium neoaurum]
MRLILSCAAAVLVLAGCATDAGAPETATTSPGAAPGATGAPVPPPLVPAMPLPENAVDNAVAKLDGIAEQLLQTSGVPGMAVAVVHGGKTVYAKGFGVRDIRTGEAVDPDTVFQLASLSKPVSATVTARAVDAKTVGWDTPVAEKLPWFALSDPAVTRMLTIGDLFSHRSGLPDHAGDQLEDIGYDRRAVLEKLRQLPLDPFRISYAYTNFGLTAGAEAVAAAAGEPWEQLAQESLFGPLGMTSTSYRFSDYQGRQNRAVGHIRVAPGDYQPRYTRDPDAQSPAGGVSSSVNDMARWMSMVLAEGRPLMQPASLLPALTPQIVSSPGSEPAMRSGFYGYGFNLSTTAAARTEASHSGAFQLGAGTNVLLLPSADVGIIALTNGTISGVPEALTAQFADLVQFGEVREPWYDLYSARMLPMSDPVGSLVGKTPPADPAPAQLLSSYVGTYRNDFWGPATVSERDGKLFLGMGPRGDSFELTHWDGDVFTFSFVTENAPPGTISAATFDGAKLTLEYYDDAVFLR